MSAKRLELALERLRPADWERFERFASEFLATEMQDLRTVASPSGDAGRDAELLSPMGDTTQVLQYSVTQDWRQKIKKTAVRISETLPSARLLIYVTNQILGAQADDLKKEIRTQYGLHLDIRDRSYFLERYRRDTRTEAAAESLAQDIVDPYLTSSGVLEGRALVLDTNEARAAHVYLSLQFHDEVQEKGLTKLCFEALVRSALIRTSSENRMSRDDVRRRLRQLIPDHPTDRVDGLTDSALARLTKRAIRHWPRSDEFCLTHQEGERVAEYLASQELDEARLVDEIKTVSLGCNPSGGNLLTDIDAATVRIRRILEQCLFERAESFACAVLAGKTAQFGTDHLQQVTIDDIRADVPPKGSAESDPEWLAAVVREILGAPGAATQQYLRSLADAYTLMAFLRQTPDVQGAVQKIFSHGEIWLDTNIALPLLAEELLDDGSGQFQQMIAIATQAGLRFFVTNGVLEESERHVNRAVVCSRIGRAWEGDIPFLLEAFLQLGGDEGNFGSWTESFVGPERPVEDIAEFLKERFGIELRDLECNAAEAPAELRMAVHEAWYEIHRSRRERFGGSVDPITIARLSKHDAENYVGVIQCRTQEKASPFGYSAWWLTLDTAALRIRAALRQFRIDPPDSPILSIDFLSQYLSFGPLRQRVPKASVRTLPLMIEPRLVRFLTPELLDQASRIRAEMKGLPARVVSRRIRDHMDAERRRLGPMAKRGLDVFFDEIHQ